MRKLVLLFVVAAVVPACISFEPRRDSDIEPMASPRFEQDDAPPPASKTAEIVERVLPSLVNVKVGGFTGPGGEGSGVVIDSDGIIVTNNHVVEGAIRVQVVFQDDHEPVDGRVIGTEPASDLAVIKVPTTGLTPIKIGRSESLRLGDDVIALGFPLGLGGPTVTKGIVSGKNRSLEIPRTNGDPVRFQGLLQTDAAINPGNSGGPLVDATGRLVGINTAAAGAASAENVGFAIAIDTALPVIEEILAEPPEERAWLGVLLQNMDPTIAARLGLPPGQTGVVIEELVPGGPADDGGLDVGDVIVAVEGTDIQTFDDLTRALTGFDPGDTVTVEIVTSEGNEELEVRLEQRPPQLED